MSEINIFNKILALNSQNVKTLICGQYLSNAPVFGSDMATLAE